MRFLIAIVLFIVSCGPGEKDKSEHYYFKKTAHHPDIHWSYEGATGPEYWGKLSASYRLADTGKKQSPVNIDTSKVVVDNLPELIFRYHSGERPDFINNGHTLQHQQEQDGSEIEVAGKHYQLEQFHLHSPSEHTIDGKHFPIELHMVHKAKDGEVAVLAIFYKAGESSQALNYIASAKLPDKKGNKSVMKQGIRLNDLVPTQPEYYTYSGSFTTPPCTENVKWFVLKQELEADEELLKNLAEILKHNNRPIQDLDGREIHGFGS
ncbi:MAG: carbonic anhydrase family protein [Verrucomicrobiales bacterium]|nr:carbonic anhydrase family protein [Verrucomicrobiales bacterium]